MSSNTTPNPESNTKTIENRFATLMQVEEIRKPRDITKDGAKHVPPNVHMSKSLGPRITRRKINADPSITDIVGK